MLSPACCKQRNGICPPHIHRSWEAYFGPSLYVVEGCNNHFSQCELHVVDSVVAVVLRRVVGVAPAEAPVPLLPHVGAVELLHLDVGVTHVGVVLVEPEIRFSLRAGNKNSPNYVRFVVFSGA